MIEPTPRRGPLQIIYALLRNMREPIKKFHLIRETNIGHKTLFRHLPLLLERGLVKKVPYVSMRGHRMSKATPFLFMITNEGEDLVKLFERIYNILGWSVS